MKKAKQRVIAIDYFRGLFILMVVINHAILFSMPFAYITGAGRLWTSAAELLLLISGLTFWIVRSEQIKTNFSGVYKKTLRRAGQIYIANIVVVVISLLLAYFAVTHGFTNNVDGALPATSGLPLLLSILGMTYSIGWGGFLGLYAVFLAIAPIMLYVLRTRLWPLIPFLSAAIYLTSTQIPTVSSIYKWYGLWQVYFVLGLLIGKYRLSILSRFYGLKQDFKRKVALTLLSVSAVALGICVLVEDNNLFYPTVAHLATSGWIPLKIQSAYLHLIWQRPMLDQLFINSRAGILRPMFALVFMAGLYIFYQHYKDYILRKSGKFVVNLGKDTLWIFAAQAFTIPLLAMLPLQRDNLLNNTLLTAALLVTTLSVTKRHNIKPAITNYAAELKSSYKSSKYNYLQNLESEES